MTWHETTIGVLPGSIRLAVTRASVWLEAKPIRKHGAALLLLLALATAAVLYFRSSAPGGFLPFDDSYITLTYAHNIAFHARFAFDIDLPKSGSGATSPLHVFILAAAIRIAGGFLSEVQASQLLGVVFHFSLVTVTYWLGHLAFNRTGPAVLGAFLTSATGYVLYDSLNGLETTLFLTLNISVAAHLLSDREGKRPLVTGGLMTMTILTRPEGVFLAAAVGLFELQTVSPPRASVATLRLAISTCNLRRGAACLL